jgi:hypothetical protein
MEATTIIGRTPMMYITRQPMPSIPPNARSTMAAAPIASIEPIGRPICIRAPPRPRYLDGHVSATSAAPDVQAPPMPRPAQKRSTATQLAEGANAVAPEKHE